MAEVTSCLISIQPTVDMDQSLLLKKLFGDEKTWRIVHSLLHHLDILKDVMIIPLERLEACVNTTLKKRPNDITLEFWSVPIPKVELYLPCYTKSMKPLIDRLSFIRDDGMVLVSILDILTLLTLLMFGNWDKKAKLLFTWYNLNEKGLLEEEEHFLMIKRVSLCLKSIKLIGILDISDNEANYIAGEARIRYDKNGVGMFIPGLFFDDFLGWTRTNKLCSGIFFFCEVLNRLCQMLGSLVDRTEKLTSIIKDVFEEKVDPLPVCPPSTHRPLSQSVFVSYRSHNLFSICMETSLIKDKRIYVQLDYDVPMKRRETAHPSCYYEIDENIINRNQDLNNIAFTPGLLSGQKVYSKRKTILLGNDVDFQLGTNQPWQRVVIDNLETDISYKVTIFTETIQFHPFQVQTLPLRKKAIIDIEKKLFILALPVDLEQVQQQLLRRLTNNDICLLTGPILNFSEFFEGMKSSLPTTFQSLSDFRSFLFNFSKSFELFLRNHLMSKVIRLHHLFSVSDLNDRSPLFLCNSTKQFFFYPGFPILYPVSLRLFYLEKLGENLFSLFEYILEEKYYSYLHPLLPPKRELQAHSFNLYLLTPGKFHLLQNGVNSRFSTYSIFELIGILKNKQENPKIISPVEKQLLVIVRDPLDLLPSMHRDFREFFDFFFNFTSKDANGKEENGSEFNLSDQTQSMLKDGDPKAKAPLLFGKYELIHGEYSNPKAPTATATVSEAKSGVDLFPKKVNADPELFDDAFYTLIKFSLLYALSLFDTPNSGSSYVHFLFTNWNGKEFDICFEHNDIEIFIQFRKDPSRDQESEEPLPEDYLRKLQETEYDLFNRIEASLPQHVKLRMLHNEGQSEAFSQDSISTSKIWELQRTRVDTILSVTSIFSSDFIFLQGLASPILELFPLKILQGPVVTSINTGEMAIQAVVTGEGKTFCTLYQLPLLIDYNTFSSIIINYRDKFAHQQIGKTQIRENRGKPMTVNFIFTGLTANCHYGVVLDTTESLKFSTKVDELFPGEELKSPSTLSSQEIPRILVTKTLPSIYSSYISNSILCGLSNNDYSHDSFRMIKLNAINEMSRRISTNQLVGLVGHRGLIDSEDLVNSNGLVKYKNIILKNPLTSLQQKYSISLQQLTCSSLQHCQTNYYPSSQQSSVQLTSSLSSNSSLSHNQVTFLPKLSSIQVRFDNFFCYIVPLFTTNECLEEIIYFIQNNLYQKEADTFSSTSKVLVIYNMQAIVDILHHTFSSNDWIRDGDQYFLNSKKLIREFFETLLNWKIRTHGEVTLISVGIVPEITSIMIGYYSEGGIFHNPAYHQGEALEAKEEEKSQGNQDIPFFPSLANVSKVVEESVFNRKSCIYLHIFPMYSYNPLTLAAEKDDSEEEEEEVVVEAAQAVLPPSTYSNEEFLQFPNYEVKLTDKILYKVVSANEMKSSQELLLQYKPLIRMYHKSRTIQFREPVLFHVTYIYNYRGIRQLFDPLATSNSPPIFPEYPLTDDSTFHSSDIQSLRQVDNVSSLYTRLSQDISGSQLKLIIRNVIDEKDYFQIVYGPIIGKVTSREIRVMFEFNMNLSEISCLLIPANQREEEAIQQINQYTCLKEMTKEYSPVVFVFENCEPDTIYNIYLPSLYPNKLIGTVKTHPMVALKTEIVFVGSHHYQNISIKDVFLFQMKQFQFPNLYDLMTLQNRNHGINLINPGNLFELPSIFEIIDRHLIQTNQLENIMIMFHLDSVTFFTHYWEEVKQKCYDHAKQYLTISQLKQNQIEDVQKEKEQAKHLMDQQLRKKKGYRGFLPDETIQKVEQDVESKFRPYDTLIDDLLIEYYYQQVVDIMTDSIRIIWSNPDVANILSRCCHIPLFHTDYLLPNKSPSYKIEKEVQDPLSEESIMEFIRSLFDKQVKAYILELYGMEKNAKHEMRVWKVGPLMVVLLDLVSGRTKLKSAHRNIQFDQTDAEAHEELKGNIGREDDEGEQKDEIEQDKQIQEENNDIKVEESTSFQKSGKSLKKDENDEDEDGGETKKKFPFSPGFIEKNQWKTLRKLCIDDKITQLIIGLEKPLIPLSEVLREYNLEVADNLGGNGKIPPGDVIPIQPTYQDLESFFSYWIDWIARIRNVSNNIESRSVIFVSKSSVSYSTVIQDLKTGIKLHQVCVGDYQLSFEAEEEATKVKVNKDDFVMNGKIGTMKYIHTLKAQDYVRMTSFETDPKRNINRQLKSLLQEDGHLDYEESTEERKKMEAKRATAPRRSEKKSKSRLKIRKTFIDATVAESGSKYNEERNETVDGIDVGARATMDIEEQQMIEANKQQLVSKMKQYPRGIQGNVGFAQLKLWLDRWNPISVWSNVDMNMLHKNYDLAAGKGKGKVEKRFPRVGDAPRKDHGFDNIKKTLGASIDSKKGDSGLTKDMQEDTLHHKGEYEDDGDDDEELEDAVLLFGPILGAPVIFTSATEENAEEEEEEKLFDASKKTRANNKEDDFKSKENQETESKKIFVKVPIMIEVDQTATLQILLSPIFSPKKQHLFFIKNIPPLKPYAFEVGPLLLEERYQVSVLSGLKPSPFNSFIISTHSHWDETNVIMINCELPELGSSNPRDEAVSNATTSVTSSNVKSNSETGTSHSNFTIQPSPLLMVDLFQRCTIPFHGINCIVHNNFQPNFDSFIEQQGNSFQLKQKLFLYAQTKKISQELRLEMNLLFNLFRNGFRDQYSRPSYRELLKVGCNLLVPQYFSLNDYLQINEASLNVRKKRRKKRSSRSSFLAVYNQKKEQEAAIEAARTLNPSKMNGILLLQLMEQRIIQEYIEQFRYPNCNIFRAVLDTMNEPSLMEYQQNNHQFTKPDHPIQHAIVEQFNHLYNADYRTETFRAKALTSKKSRKTSSIPPLGLPKSTKPGSEQPADGSTTHSERFQLVWSDPQDDPVDAVLKQWGIASLPAPTQWLPFYSVNGKVSVECHSLIHVYEPPLLVSPASMNTMNVELATPSKAFEIPKQPKYVSNHLQDYHNHRSLNALQAISKQEIPSNVRIVVLNNKRFYSNNLSREQQYSLNKSIFESLFKNKNISQYADIVLTNLSTVLESNKRKFSVSSVSSQRKTSMGAPVTSPQPARKTSMGPPVTSPQPARKTSMSPPVTSPQPARKTSMGPPVTSPQPARKTSMSPPVTSPQPARKTSMGPPVTSPQPARKISMGTVTSSLTEVRGELSRSPSVVTADNTITNESQTEEDEDLSLLAPKNNPHQQLLLQFAMIFSMLEQWRSQLFGRKFLLCLPVQIKALGTCLDEVYYITEDDLNTMLQNFNDFENDVVNKYSRRKSVAELTTMITQNIPHFTNDITKIPIYLIDSIYRSNEYERNAILSEKRLTMPKKKLNLSQIKSKRAQKKKEEEEIRQMKMILAEIENISQQQMPDGFLLLQCHSVKVYTEITRNSNESKHASFFDKIDGAAETLSPRQNDEKKPQSTSPFVSPRKLLSQPTSPREKEEKQMIEDNPPTSPPIVIREKIQETVTDIITNITAHIMGDKLAMQKQFELQYPTTVASTVDVDSDNPMKIINRSFEDFYESRKFDLLQLPDWFIAIFPSDETVFIEDEVWFVMKQHTKISKLLEQFEQIFSMLSNSQGSLVRDVSAVRENNFYFSVLKEYELSRIYELSLPEDLREIDFKMSGNMAIFFKDFVTSLWFARHRRQQSRIIETDETDEAHETNKAIERTSSKEEADKFIINDDMKYYMLNISDDFVRSFCFSKSFHQIIFDQVVSGGDNTNGMGFATQDDLMDYLNANREKFENFYHHSAENISLVLSSRHLFIKSIMLALYYSMVMKMGKTISTNEKYSYLLKRKDRISRLVQAIERVEKKLFLKKLEEDKQLLSLDAAQRVLEMVEAIPVNAKQRKALQDQEKEKEKEKEKKEKENEKEKAKGNKKDEVNIVETENKPDNSRQFLIFLTPEEEEELIKQFNDSYQEQFSQDLFNIEYTPEEYEQNQMDDYNMTDLISPRLKSDYNKTLNEETEALLSKERDEKRKDQRQKEKEEYDKTKTNNLMNLTEDELKAQELSMFQEISEEEVKKLQDYRSKIILEGIAPLLERVIDLVIVDAIDQLSFQLVEENIIFPNYDLNEENRRLKAEMHVQRMSKQRQLLRRKYGKRITFLQFK